MGSPPRHLSCRDAGEAHLPQRVAICAPMARSNSTAQSRRILCDATSKPCETMHRLSLTRPAGALAA